MSSVHQLIRWAGYANYAASKGGVTMLMKSVAQEVAEKRIRIDAIAPDAIKTNINKNTRSDPSQAKTLLKLIPHGRLGGPEMSRKS